MERWSFDKQMMPWLKDGIKTSKRCHGQRLPIKQIDDAKLEE